MKDYVAENERILNEWRKSNEKNGETNFADDGIMYRGEADQTERYDLIINKKIKCGMKLHCASCS